MAQRDVAAALKERGYAELKLVGEGAFGKALLVEGSDGTKLICKMVDISKASKKEQDNALKEGKLLASLKHPYIVRYRDSFNTRGCLCIFMDYCQGGDLAKQINDAKTRRQCIPEDKVLRWFTQATLALKHIHGRHILHRDLKPSNFFLSKRGVVKLGDFGIAKVLASTMACARTQIGTPYYLSPEVCQDKPYAWASDIWAMGCVLFELSSLRVPFDAPSISGLMQKIIRGPTPQLAKTSSEFLCVLCAETLNRNASSRPSADELLKRPKIQEIVRFLLDEAQETGALAAAPPQHRGHSCEASPRRGGEGRGQEQQRQGSASPAPRHGRAEAASPSPSRGRDHGREASPGRGHAREASLASGRSPSPSLPQAACVLNTPRKGAGAGQRPPGLPRADSPFRRNAAAVIARGGGA